MIWILLFSVVPEGSYVVFIFFSIFSLYYILQQWFSSFLSSRSFIHFFLPFYSAIDSLLCISIYLFFSSFRSLVKHFCIFPIFLWDPDRGSLPISALISLSPPSWGFILLLHLRQYYAFSFWLLPGGQMIKHKPTMWETWGQSLCQEDPLRKKHNPPWYSCLEMYMDGGPW